MMVSETSGKVWGRKGLHPN